MSKVKRASLERLLQFANEIRLAGGGNPIDALIPAVPADASRCLIAKNLNFNCEVNGGLHGQWAMWVGEDSVLAFKIAKATGCQPTFSTTTEWDSETRDYLPVKVYQYGVILPDDIGKVAADFDQSWELLTEKVEDLYYNDFHAHEADENHQMEYGFSLDAVTGVRTYHRLDGKPIEIPAGEYMDAELVGLVEESKKETYKNATIVNPDGSIIL